MATATAVRKPKVAESSWIKGLSSMMDLAVSQDSPERHTTISCRLKRDRLAFVLPRDMQAHQPQNLRYMHKMAKKHNCRLVESRVSSHVYPTIPLPDASNSALALCMSSLLSKAGMPGIAPEPSHPHELRVGSQHYDVEQLIAMAAKATPRAKKVVLPPNPLIAALLHERAAPINGYACKIKTSFDSIDLAYFDSKHFKAVGYITGGQCVMHVLLAGGPIHSPQLWVNAQTLSKDSFTFSLFEGKHSGLNVGLMYNTIYLDLNN